ncbi:hypothetical protein BC830DRAFT_1150213 [Chytriomyces sp. MP71]|nr:hypothetical protein BC830DRAFT_1150213 [Chytriomyces sp. MP71]
MNSSDCTAVGTALNIQWTADCCTASNGIVACNANNRITQITASCDPANLDASPWSNRPFPIGLEVATQLQVLNLNGCNLSGGLPDTWGDFTALYQLHVNDNQLTGSLPPSLGNVFSMQYLHIENNRFTGDIPAMWGQLANVVTVGDAGGNCLTGSSPVPALSFGTQRTDCGTAVASESAMTASATTTVVGGGAVESSVTSTSANGGDTMGGATGTAMAIATGTMQASSTIQAFTAASASSGAAVLVPSSPVSTTLSKSSAGSLGGNIMVIIGICSVFL